MTNRDRNPFQPRLINNIHPFLFNQMQLFFILFTLLLPILSQISLITLQSPTTTPITMYQNNQISPQFNDISKQFNCALPNIYIYQQTPAQFQANIPYSINITSNGTYGITYSTRYNNFKPLLSSSVCMDNCTIMITNNCPNPFDNYNYFDEINLYFGDLPPISYRINCEATFTPSSIFQWGLFILIFLSTFLIFGSTYLSKSHAYDGFGVTLGYPLLVLVFISSTLIGILGVFYTPIINDIVQAFCWLLGIISVGACFNQFLFVLGFKALNTPIFQIKSYLFKFLRPTQLISLAVGVSFTSAWWFLDKNWIINDIISCCIVLFTVQFFKFTSLKVSTCYFIMIICVELSVALCIKFFIGVSYEILILNKYNNPLEFQFPTITKTLNLKCSWFPISESIFPAILISYMKRFDTHRQTRVYILVSSISFFVGCMTWMVLYVFNEVSIIPLGLFTQPILLTVISLFAVKRNEIKVLWHGTFYDTDYKDRDSFKNDFRKTREPDKDQNQMDTIPFQIGAAILKSLKIDEMSEFQSSARPTIKNISFELSINR